jgi:hypothetical protein
MKDLSAQVREELTQLERIQAGLAAIAGRTDEARLAELIQLRRELAQQINLMGQAAERYFTAIEDSDLMRVYRGHYSEMRSKAALHQANWPAVRLKDAGAEYQISARAVREANKAFTAWMRSQLGY